LAKVSADMVNPSNSERWNRAGIDDNMLAMFDASETKDPHQDALDDRTKNPFFFVFFYIILLGWFFSPFSLHLSTTFVPTRKIDVL